MRTPIFCLTVTAVLIGGFCFTARAQCGDLGPDNCIEDRWEVREKNPKKNKFFASTPEEYKDWVEQHPYLFKVLPSGTSPVEYLQNLVGASSLQEVFEVVVIFGVLVPQGELVTGSRQISALAWEGDKLEFSVPLVAPKRRLEFGAQPETGNFYLFVIKKDALGLKAEDQVQGYSANLAPSEDDDEDGEEDE